MKNSVKNSATVAPQVTPMSPAIMQTLLYNALLEKYGDAATVDTLLLIADTFDTGNGVIAAMLLGRYQLPEYAGVTQLWNDDRKVVADVTGYDPFTDSFHVEYTFEETREMYFASESDAACNHDGKSWYDRNDGDRKREIMRKIPTGKTRTEQDTIPVSRLTMLDRNSNWYWTNPKPSVEDADQLTDNERAAMLA